MSEKDQKMSKKNPLNEAIKVVVRCRPMSEKETLNSCSRVVDIHTDKGLVELKNPKEEGPESIKSFTFDAVYDWNSTTEELYEETVWPLVKSVLEGFNGTIFAYGQTGTGKTYTMEGSKSDINQKGIIPKSFDQIFNYINRTSDIQCLVRTSYLEIYQEEIRDLLRQDQTKRLELRESASSGVYIQDLSTCVCRNVEEIVHVMNVGNKNRSIGSTNMNEQSSRSHALFIITVELSYQIQNENIVRIGKLNLVDLAGSERQSKSGASGRRLKEASKINLSLSALSNVISALADGKNQHIPYRDSKLTRILQDSLGGNSKTIMIANIGPASYNYDESLTTLRYANRAKNIRNRPKVNEDPKDTLLREYQDEIIRLKTLLSQMEIKKEKNISFKKEKKKNFDELQIQNDDRKLTPEAKQELILQLESKKKMLEEEKLTTEKLEVKLRELESKLINGGKNIIDHTNEQQRALELRNQEIADRKKKEVEMKQKLELQEESAVEIMGTYASLHQEVEEKTKRLRKIFAKLQSTKQEIQDCTEEYNADRRELEQTRNDLLKELKKKYLIIENFISPEVKQKFSERLYYDDEKDDWFKNAYSKDEFTYRPISNVLNHRPLSDYSKLKKEMGLNCPRFKEQNIMLLTLDPHLRTTEDYEVPPVAPTIQAVLEEALKADEDIDVDVASITLKRTPTSAPSGGALRAKSSKHKEKKYYEAEEAVPAGFRQLYSYPKPRGLVPK